jgi:hypothetical protein
MRPKDILFIAEEITGDACAIARSEAGHAVLCRIFEYLPQKYTARLIEELLKSVRELCCHRYASFVISHVIDYSSRPYQRRTCEMIITNAKFLSRCPTALPLLKKAQLYLRTKLQM